MSPARRGPSIGRLLLAANLLVLGVPIVAIMLLRLYEQHLVAQTEGRLIAEATLIGEAWRGQLLLAQGWRPTRPAASSRRASSGSGSSPMSR
ncbi:MAG: hypothetical protein R3F60_04140 [bacterium]